jgi:predicted RNase H-like HicB family nuclease
MERLIEKYRREIRWSDEDGCYIGRCPELFLGGCHGDRREDVEDQLKTIIAEVIHDYRKSGRPLPPPARRNPRLNSAVEARKRTGLSQSNFARAIGIGIGTLRNWEQGRVKPKGTAETLLRIIERHPEILREIA